MQTRFRLCIHKKNIYIYIWRNKRAATGVVVISPPMITDLMTERFDESDIVSPNANLRFWLQWEVLVSLESVVFCVGAQKC